MNTNFQYYNCVQMILTTVTEELRKVIQNDKKTFIVDVANNFSPKKYRLSIFNDNIPKGGVVMLYPKDTRAIYIGCQEGKGIQLALGSDANQKVAEGKWFVIEGETDEQTAEVSSQVVYNWLWHGKSPDETS